MCTWATSVTQAKQRGMVPCTGRAHDVDWHRPRPIRRQLLSQWHIPMPMFSRPHTPLHLERPPYTCAAYSSVPMYVGLSRIAIGSVVPHLPVLVRAIWPTASRWLASPTKERANSASGPELSQTHIPRACQPKGPHCPSSRPHTMCV